MRIGHNITSMNSIRNMNISFNALGKSIQGLNSGLRINRAEDDAAGLSICEKMKAQIRGLNQASNNIQDGISFIQTTEGALNEISSLLQRGYELSVQASNDTYVTKDKENIQDEINEIISEINRIFKDTEFNNIKIFNNKNGKIDNKATNIYINIENDYKSNGETQESIGTIGSEEVNYTGKEAELAKEIKKIAEGAASNIINTFSCLYASSSNIKIGLNLDNLDGKNGKLASVKFNGTIENKEDGSISASLEFSLNIDISDFPVDSYDKGELAAAISHEMMHVVMYDIFTKDMINNVYPNWFVEGISQVIGGGMTGGHNIDAHTYNDLQMKDYLSNYQNDVYGAGYFVTMYLGAAINSKVNGNMNIVSSFNEGSTKQGLFILFNELVKGKSLDEIISENTIYSGLEDFQNSVHIDAVEYSKNLASEVNKSNGTGSILVGVYKNSNDLYCSITGASTTKYDIDITSKSVTNIFETNKSQTGGNQGNQGQQKYNGLMFQVGANSNQSITCKLFNMSISELNIDNVSVVDYTGASHAINSFNDAILKVSKMRSYYGAIENRLEHTKINTDNASEKLQDSESNIRDIDMAREIMNYYKNNIVTQAAMSMITQSNQRHNSVLQLLQ